MQLRIGRKAPKLVIWSLLSGRWHHIDQPGGHYYSKPDLPVARQRSFSIQRRRHFLFRSLFSPSRQRILPWTAGKRKERGFLGLKRTLGLVATMVFSVRSMTLLISALRFHSLWPGGTAASRHIILWVLGRIRHFYRPPGCNNPPHSLHSPNPLLFFCSAPLPIPVTSR